MPDTSKKYKMIFTKWVAGLPDSYTFDLGRIRSTGPPTVPVHPLLVYACHTVLPPEFKDHIASDATKVTANAVNILVSLKDKFDTYFVKQLHGIVSGECLKLELKREFEFIDDDGAVITDSNQLLLVGGHLAPCLRQALITSRNTGFRFREKGDVDTVIS